MRTFIQKEVALRFSIIILVNFVYSCSTIVTPISEDYHIKNVCILENKHYYVEGIIDEVISHLKKRNVKVTFIKADSHQPCRFIVKYESKSDVSGYRARLSELGLYLYDGNKRIGNAIVLFDGTHDSQHLADAIDELFGLKNDRKDLQ